MLSRAASNRLQPISALRSEAVLERGERGDAGQRTTSCVATSSKTNITYRLT